MPKVVAITFDPLRDTPEVLKEYVRHFDKEW
jgi:protein SCO1/2